jgi:hypothetical protein
MKIKSFFLSTVFFYTSQDNLISSQLTENDKISFSQNNNINNYIKKNDYLKKTSYIKDKESSQIIEGPLKTDINIKSKIKNIFFILLVVVVVVCLMVIIPILKEKKDRKKKKEAEIIALKNNLILQEKKDRKKKEKKIIALKNINNKKEPLGFITSCAKKQILTCYSCSSANESLAKEEEEGYLKLFDDIDNNYKTIYHLLSRKKIEKYKKKSFKEFLNKNIAKGTISEHYWNNWQEKETKDKEAKERGKR